MAEERRLCELSGIQVSLVLCGAFRLFEAYEGSTQVLSFDLVFFF